MLSEHLSVARNRIVRIVDCCLLEKYLKLSKFPKKEKLNIRTLCYFLIFTVRFAISKYNDIVMDYVIRFTGLNTVFTVTLPSLLLLFMLSVTYVT